MSDIPKAALDLIKKFEGYAKRRPDGGCEAYQEIINGKCEIHAKRVTRLVTVELNANQRGALISFDFNAGGLTLGNGKPSKVLKLINAGELDKVPDALMEWTRFGGKTSKGLVARRSAEVALWLHPVDDVPPDYMPQAPEKPPALTDGQKAAAGTGGGVLLVAGERAVNDPQGTIDTLNKAALSVSAMPPSMLAALIVVAAAGLAFWLHKRSS